MNIANTGPSNTTTMEALKAAIQFVPVTSSNQPITTGETAPATAMPKNVQALDVAEC